MGHNYIKLEITLWFAILGYGFINYVHQIPRYILLQLIYFTFK